MKPRIKAILICVLLVMVFAVLFKTYGYQETWRLWNIPTMSPHFADLRTITHGAESRARGLDPMLDNPADPWQRRLDYPRIWQGLYRLGVDDSDTTLLGCLVILAFLVGVCLILPDPGTPVLAAVFLAVLSPAVLFGVERGNIDLLMFFFAAVAATVVKRSPLLAGAALVAGFVLKLFPLFGCVVLLRAGRTTFRRAAIVLAGIAVAYLLATHSDLGLMREASMRGTTLSFGVDVLWMKIGALNEAAGGTARILSYLAVVLIGVGASFAGLRPGSPAVWHGESATLDAFRVGAAIVVGSFLFEINWDYRLAFLILTIPQLMAWATVRATALAVPTLAAAFLAMWYPVVGAVLERLPHGGLVRLVLEDAATWIVFAGLLFLLLWSAPEWLKKDARTGPFTT